MPRFRAHARLLITVSVLAVATGTSVAATATVGHTAAHANSVVRTTDGAIRGFASDGVRVFDGVPYARPPVGELRWRPPQPVAGWSGVRDTTRPGPDCVQTAVAWRPAAASTNEDCLYLNVWTPLDMQRDSALPVAVWFHGGGYVNGAGRDFRPVAMVREGNLLVVTVNYRLGAMGYLSLPQLDADNGADSGNYGLLDQIQALRWVQQNIARFGGDPSRVMIAGQSAGAESVCSLLASPAASGLFSTAVVESGLSCSGNPVAQAQAQDASFVAALGCDSSNAAAVVTCLRSKPASDILNAQQHAGSWRPTTGTAVLPQQPQDAFAAGAFNHVPVLIGGTSHETRAFVYEQNDLINQPVTAAGYLASVNKTYGANAPAVLAHYPLADYSVPGAALAAVGTDSGFSCPELASAASLSRAVPTYVYEFRDETAPLRPYELVPSSFSLATQHSAELPYLWGSNSTTPLTPRQHRLSSDMIAYWARFARTGTLTVRGLPDVPRYSPASPHEVAFNSNGPALVTDMGAVHQCSFWASLS